jgi:hypothetical protein
MPWMHSDQDRAFHKDLMLHAERWFHADRLSLKRLRHGDVVVGTLRVCAELGWLVNEDGVEISVRYADVDAILDDGWVVD